MTITIVSLYYLHCRFNIRHIRPIRSMSLISLNSLIIFLYMSLNVLLPDIFNSKHVNSLIWLSQSSGYDDLNCCRGLSFCRGLNCCRGLSCCRGLNCCSVLSCCNVVNCLLKCSSYFCLSDCFSVSPNSSGYELLSFNTCGYSRSDIVVDCPVALVVPSPKQFDSDTRVKRLHWFQRQIPVFFHKCDPLDVNSAEFEIYSKY